MLKTFRPILPRPVPLRHSPRYERARGWIVMLVCFWTCAPPAGWAGELRDISGMARLDDKRFLVVHDTKSFESAPSLGILSPQPDSPPRYEPLVMDPVSALSGPMNDLESVCPYPGKPGEFLVSESGYYQGKFGRLFHIRVEEGGTGWMGKIERIFPLPREVENIEGLLCLPDPGGERYLIVILGERGGDRPGQLLWCRIDLRAHHARPRVLKTIPLSAPGWPPGIRHRDIFDLFLDRKGILWVASARDGGDAGPFGSIISRAKFHGNRVEKFSSLKPRAVWIVDGYKIEALGPALTPGSVLSMASDDENFGGTWRPLFPPPRLRGPR